MLTEREIREQALRWASTTEQLQRVVADGVPNAHAKKRAMERALVLPRPKLDQRSTPHAFRRSRTNAQREESRRGGA